jgi:tRNA-specific 2-thiouridylase
MHKGRVVVGMSGGVDSSVAAWILIEQGYEVIGMFMKNWHDTSVTISDDCPWIDDSQDALQVAESLGIPFQTIDLSEEYRKRIVDYMFAEYEAGRTPNPDVLCNREIKFDVFLQAAMQLDADYVATGHYCQKKEIHENGETYYQLIAGADKNKDQSYFLCQLSQSQLKKALFPIGSMQKNEVRETARKAGLLTADKKDSQGLCFIGKVRLPEFLQQQLKPQKGKVILVDEKHPNFLVSSDADLDTLCSPYTFAPNMGKEIGEHQGAHYYTIGQRKGLGIGGFPLPLFVLNTDTQNNIIYLGQGETHSGLHRNGLFIKNEDIHWVRTDKKLEVGKEAHYMVRIRYRQALQAAQLIQKENGLYILFNSKQKGITPGQFAAWYANDELIGSGVING